MRLQDEADSLDGWIQSAPIYWHRGSEARAWALLSAEIRRQTRAIRGD